MPRLTENQRNEAMGMSRAGMSTRAIARHFNCHQSTIVRLVERVRVTGSTRDRQRPGPQRVTTQAQDRYIRVTHLRDRFRPATRTGAAVVGRQGPVSANTVRRRLREVGLRARRPYVGAILRDHHRQRRLIWAQGHQTWRRVDWQSVLFSDESRFHLYHADGRQRVWRRLGERLADCCVFETNRWGGGSVMVWGGFTFHHRTALHICRGRVNAVAYRDDVLQPIVVPMFRAHPQLQHFQQDNARPHTARFSMDYLAANNINVLDWPAMSPDMAPIEHVWDEIGRRLYRRPQMHTIAALEAALVQEWNNLPQAFFQTLVNSMRRRCTACVRARGGHTRY